MRLKWINKAARLVCSIVAVHITASLCVLSAQTPQCIFDEVKIEPSKLRRCLLTYQDKHQLDSALSRRKRSVDDLYQPMRINVQFHDLDKHLNTNEKNNLKRVVRRTIGKVTNIFKVIPVEGSLLLARSPDACFTTLLSGINKGKCISPRSTYVGEECLDNFLIPEEHLEGLALWNLTYPEPIREVYQSGSGLADTDYVLYVRSITSPTCVGQGQNTISYAAYCQVDQNDRPVAGYINFCPSLLREANFDEEKVATTALHEVFHALGFASDLFPKFKDCYKTDTGFECRDEHKTVKTVENAERFVTPKVVELTSAHFGCQTHQTVNEFGPILQTENGVVRSHWDAAFMHGSLMTPNIGQPHSTVLDAITLALFEDSGWYRVDYLYADTFPWGKGAGCMFGQNPACEVAEGVSSYFCTGREVGCHYLHYDKGVCNTDSFLHGCRVYKAKAETSCLDPRNGPSQEAQARDGELYSTESRCFLSNATSSLGSTTPLTGRCFHHMCNSTDVYVRVGSSPYCQCPPGELITIPGYLGVVECPQLGVLCSERLEPSTTTIAPATTTHRQVVKTDSSGIICIDILYSKKHLHITSRQSIRFQNCNLETILLWTHISRRRLENFYILPGEVVFRFDLLPMTYTDEGPPSMEVVSILEDVVRNGSFKFLLTPQGPEYVATDIHRMTGGPTVSQGELPGGVIAGAAVGAVAGAILLGVLIFLAQKYHSNQSLMEAARRESQEQLRRQQLRSRSHQTTPTSRSFSNYSRSRPPEPPRSIQRSEDPRILPANAPQSELYHPHLSEMDDKRDRSQGHGSPPQNSRAYYIPAENGYHITSDMPVEDVAPPNFRSICQHRPSVSSLPDGDTHSIGPVSVSSNISDFSATSSYSETPVSEQDHEDGQCGVTIVI